MHGSGGHSAPSRSSAPKHPPARSVGHSASLRAARLAGHPQTGAGFHLAIG